MLFDELKNKIDIISQTKEKSLKKLGEEIRKEIILPLCKKFNLEFFSHSDSFAFFKKNENVSFCAFGYCQELPRNLKKHVGPVVELLSTEVGRNNCIGFYVSDVIAKDYEKIKDD
jgi:hypothetical protein